VTEDLEHRPACQACGVRLTWLQHETTGHWLPLERVAAYCIGEGTSPRAMPIGAPIYVSHFLTCPDRRGLTRGGRRRGQGRRLP